MSKNHYLVGKFVKEHQENYSPAEIMDLLAIEFLNPGFKMTNPSVISKLATVYKVYVENYGFSIVELEALPAFGLYDAQRSIKNYPPLIQNKDDATEVIQKVGAGEKLQELYRKHTGKSGTHK